MIGLNVARYGGPLASGYGDTGTIFAAAHLAPNAARYSRWLLETHTPLLLLALPANAVVLSVQQSSSLRFHGGSLRARAGGVPSHRGGGADADPISTSASRGLDRRVRDLYTL